MHIVVKGRSTNYNIYFPESNGSNPSFTIATPDGSVFLSGTGTPVANMTDWYTITTTIPVSAPASDPDNQWSITWVHGTIQKVVYFDVTDPELADDEIYQRELTKLGIAGSDYSARMIVSGSPTDALLDFYNSSGILIKGISVVIETHRLGSQLSASIPLTYMLEGEYTLVWTTDVIDYFQRLLVVSPTTLPVIQKVRFIIDRIIKRLDEPQSYTDADVYAGIYGGLDVINGWSPVTNYSMNSLPDSLKPFLPIAGSWYMLNSQFMLEADLAFSYSGQTVTLDYDRSGPIESEIGRLWEFMSENLGKAKRSVLRGTMGALGVTTGPTPKLGTVFVDRHTRLIRRR